MGTVIGFEPFPPLYILILILVYLSCLNFADNLCPRLPNKYEDIKVRTVQTLKEAII